MNERLPVVFACAGCSFAGQLAYKLALELDKRGHAEMSCLAGVGAEKPVFFRKMNDRQVWVIDGCPIECGQGIFDRVDRTAHVHIRLHDLGYKKTGPPEGGVDMDRLVEQALEQVSRQSRMIPQVNTEEAVP